MRCTAVGTSATRRAPRGASRQRAEGTLRLAAVTEPGARLPGRPARPPLHRGRAKRRPAAPRPPRRWTVAIAALNGWAGPPRRRAEAALRLAAPALRRPLGRRFPAHGQNGAAPRPAPREELRPRDGWQPSLGRVV